jgi:hypothetical protein
MFTLLHAQEETNEPGCTNNTRISQTVVGFLNNSDIFYDATTVHMADRFESALVEDLLYFLVG